ncbi:MAG: radical SAM protein [Planctomycetes bacterium]|nr:radical SAM protein [Planctomycetota bacterium]
MTDRYVLTTEFFAVPYCEDTFLLYSPLKQILILANTEMVDMVAALRDGTFAGVDGANMDAMQLLLESGAINGTPDEPPRRPPAAEWKPTEVTLFLTNACNLRCSYCYASGGDSSGTMEVATALAAVDLVVRNASELHAPEVRVSYHGGGEPTLTWEALTASALRAEESAARHGLRASINLATNGVMPARKVDWLVRHVHEFSVSWDGPAWVQDLHRPTAAGRGSAETVEATMRHLDSHGARWGVRLTVTETGVDRLEEIVEYLLRRFSPSTVHIEPLFAHGRARERGLRAPHARAFVENFRKAQRVADRRGIDLYYSGARSELVTDTFCAVPEGTFNVTPEGLLTSCFEACRPGDPFVYGAFEGGEFRISRPKLDALAAHTVEARPECARCFCKRHCAGDCAAKNLTSDLHPDERLKAARCAINQELTRDQLVRRLREKSRMMAQVEAMLGAPPALEEMRHA